MDRARLVLVLAVAAHLPVVVRGASCPGTVQMTSSDTDAPLQVSFVPTGWGSPGGGAKFEVDGSGNVVPHRGSRAYFALDCTPGEYDNRQYVGMNLLGKTLRYTVDLSGAGCGCNAALYLTSMNLNGKKSECGDHYCDANNVCGESCAEIDIQEANIYAWRSTLHTESDPIGVGGGYGGGGKNWSGPRDWTGMQYSPGGKCIDTSEPFRVAVSFPVNATGWLAGMVVVLSQAGHSCTLKTSITSYEGMEELSRAIRVGMTPIVSYWSDDEMLWMDGLGKDENGPCESDSAEDCAETVKFFNFSVGRLDRETAAEVPAAPAAGLDKDSPGAFCCLASRDEGDFCGSCPAYARADHSSHCGKSESSCAACGGKATWCTEAIPPETAAASTQEQPPSLPASTPAVEADSLAPAAAPTPLAVPTAAPTPEAPTPAPRAAGDGFCCLASTGAGAGFCSQCFPGARAVSGSLCGGSSSDCHLCGGQATWCEEVVVQHVAASDDSEDGQCCLAAKDSGDFCGSCFPNAIANSSSKCGRSRAACEDCGGGSRWCGLQLKDDGAATLALRGLEGPAKKQREGLVSNTSRAENLSTTGFCCLAAEESGGHFCGTCFPNARVQGGSRCGHSRDACKNCGGAAKWCDVFSGSDAFGGDVGEAENGGAGGKGAASKTSTSGPPKPSTTSAASKTSTTVAASKTSTASAASKTSTTSAASKSTTSAAPEPECPGVVEIWSDGLSDLPAQIVPTGWGSKYGPVPVQIANKSTISANMNARAYFAMRCTAGSYSNEDYMALNLLGRSLRYTVDLSGAGCGCNAALYLTSMRQNKNSSACSDYYCDANSVCGVACAEIDIQEANMYSWHSTLHGQDDPSGVGGGFGGGGEEWSGPRDWNASQYSPGGTCIDTRRPFDVDAAFPLDAEGSLAAMVVTLSQEGTSCSLSTLTAAYAGMPELTEALRAGMTPIVSYWSADDMVWLDGQGKDKLGVCKKDRPDRCAESVKFSNFSVGVAPTLPPTASPTPVPTSEPTPKPTTAPTGAPTSKPTTSAPTPAPTRPEGFCCLAAPNPFNYCGSCPGFAKAAEGSRCAASEDACNQCGPFVKWCEVEDPAPETFTTSRAPKSSGRGAVGLGAGEVVAEVVGKPDGDDSASELQGKFGGGGLEAAAQQSQRRGPPQTPAALLCLPGLAAVALASLAWLRRRRRAAIGSDVNSSPSARPMVQAEDSELFFA